jgi:UDP-glucose 4-epimerase
LNLLDWCAEHELDRFIYASSMAVYGLTDDKPISEHHPLKPYSFYGISKQTAENYVHHYEDKGIKSTVLRMFNVYGPGQDLSNMRQGMVSIYLSYLTQNMPILVRGSLDRFRDYIYIEDVVDAWVQCINNEATHGNTYNLASGKKTLVKDLLSHLLKAWGHDPSSYKIDQGDNTPRDQFGIYADIQAIKSDLQWKPQFSLEKGLSNMCDWAKSIPL